MDAYTYIERLRKLHAQERKKNKWKWRNGRGWRNYKDGRKVIGKDIDILAKGV